MPPDPLPSIVPAGKTWSHSPQPGRAESEVYILPHNEVLDFLMSGTDFLQTTSSQANDRWRDEIHARQYPRLREPIATDAPRAAWSSSEVARRVGQFVRDHAKRELDDRFVKVGFTPVLREHVYQDGCVSMPNAIVLGLPMRYDETNAAPQPQAGEEVTRNYMELGCLTLALGDWLRASGFAAEIHHPRGDEHCRCEAMFIPHAIHAGFGTLGRHGSMISREFGPRVRLSMITTDAPIPDPPGEAANGIAEFCTWCTKCLAACPVDAIAEHREMRRGSYRHVVDTSACLPYFAQTDGCGICIAVCPYNKPDEQASAAFYDRVRALDWVREGVAIRVASGMKAMEATVQARKVARREEGAAGPVVE